VVGALVAVPYDGLGTFSQAIGISRPLYITFQSLLAIIAHTSLASGWSVPLHLSACPRLSGPSDSGAGTGPTDGLSVRPKQ